MIWRNVWVGFSCYCSGVVTFTYIRPTCFNIIERSNIRTTYKVVTFLWRMMEFHGWVAMRDIKGIAHTTVIETNEQTTSFYFSIVAKPLKLNYYLINIFIFISRKYFINSTFNQDGEKNPDYPQQLFWVTYHWYIF